MRLDALLNWQVPGWLHDGLLLDLLLLFTILLIRLYRRPLVERTLRISKQLSLIFLVKTLHANSNISVLFELIFFLLNAILLTALIGVESL